jgi:hypothetical protein
VTGERVGDKAGPAPLIGVDDIGTPSWAQGYESVANAGLPAVARAAPRTAVLAAQWAWQTSRPLTIATAVLQLLAGVVTAFGLLATANVFSRLLEQGPTRSAWWPRFPRSPSWWWRPQPVACWTPPWPECRARSCRAWSSGHRTCCTPR